MKKTFTLLFTLTIVAIASAAPVTPGQARSVAMRFLGENEARLVRANNINGSHQVAGHYVFNASSGNGFVIVSGDDRLPAVIAYSRDGQWPTNDELVPPALRNCLKNYDVYVEALSQGKVSPRSTCVLKDNPTEVVSPLLTTEWNQNYPYNMFAPECPDTVFSAAYNAHYPIGCAAVALGQVMNYWGTKGGPQHPIGRQTKVSWGIDQNVKTDHVMTIDPNTTYDYANMPARITLTPAQSGMSQDQWNASAQAVGTLLRDVAYNLSMMWTYSGGGSDDHAMEPASYLGFGMSPEACTYSSAFMQGGISNPMWWNLIQEDLDNSRPVLYAGQDKNGHGGHAFVLDGYDSNHFVHVNWGWGGTCNNWFDISLLKTDIYDTQQGANYDFASNNVMVHGLRPMANGDAIHAASENYGVQFLTLMGGDAFGEEFSILDKKNAEIMIIPIISKLSEGVNYDLRLKLADSDMNDVVQIGYVDSAATVIPIDPLMVTTAHSLYCPAKIDESIACGNYFIYPMMKCYYGNESTDWFHPLIANPAGEALPIYIDDKHVISNVENYLRYFHDPNCLHYSGAPDNKSEVTIHTLFDQDPQRIIADSAFAINVMYNISLFEGFEAPNPFENGDIELSIYTDDGQLVDAVARVTADLFEEIEYTEHTAERSIISTMCRLPEGHYKFNVQLPVMDYETTVDLIVDCPTGVDDITVPVAADGKTYNLLGLPVGDDYKGIVIKGGNKFIQK